MLALLLFVAMFALILVLKLWACLWLYHFAVAWITTGIAPSFWSWFWAVCLVSFVLSSTSVKTND